MCQTIIKINNCNNIINGEICIESDKLNILFGRNGTGKSTIAKVIRYETQNKPLTDFTPYGNMSSSNTPSIEGIPFTNIAIFDNDYVDQDIYKPDTLISDAFDVFIRSKEYEDAKSKIDKALENIRTAITENQAIIDLQSQIGTLIDTIKLTSSNKIAKRGGAKGILEGKGAYFNPPIELDDLRPFFEGDTVTKWAAWRLQGYEQFGDKKLCPYCSLEDTEKTATINKTFIDNFDKASVETAAKISKAIEELRPYLDDDKINELLSLFGIKEDLHVLETQLTKLCAEACYLHERLTVILQFNGSSVDKDHIGDLENQLGNMKVDLRACDTFFVTELTKNEMGAVNSKIDDLLTNVNLLKSEIAKYNTNIQRRINSRKQDINEFLSLAGFKYEFEVDVDGEDNAKARLKFILPDGNSRDTQSQDKHLSWGEKHSFALILFMFDAIRNNADLIILDDPISSFDSNKKYAIINRLFKTGDHHNSLYQRTVLMLTHDFEPVIDYIQTTSGHQTPTAICATYFENIEGHLRSKPIRKNEDILSSVVLFKELAQDNNLDIGARLACLRKFIEHQFRKPQEESDAYNIISSLIHGRPHPTNDSAGLEAMSVEQIEDGNNYIKGFIENFDYTTMLELCSPQNLLKRFNSEISAYIKIILLRLYTEQEQDARVRLRNQNDVLRKYVDETFHIENDYIYSLDVRYFNIVPENIIAEANRFVLDEIKLINKEE